MSRLHESLLAARQTIAAPRRSGGDSPALQLSGNFSLKPLKLFSLSFVNFHVLVVVLF
jgi:hypothetical protein